MNAKSFLIGLLLGAIACLIVLLALYPCIWKTGEAATPERATATVLPAATVKPAMTLEPTAAAAPTATPEPATTVFFEAEDETSFHITTTGVEWDPREEIEPPWRTGYSGRGLWYLSVGGDWLLYEFNVPVTQEYVLWIRDYHDTHHTPEERVMIVEIDGREVGRFQSHAQPTTPGGVFAWHQATAMPLAQGTHTMKVTKEQTTGSAGLMDAFFFGPPGTVPPEPGEKP